MTLDCPGCQSKLRLDPAKLPPGTGAAVCPKCRTKILLPGTSPDSDITVQCGRCSARLKVKVAKLRPTASRSKCPKCGNAVSLPAAPASAASPATRVMQASPPPARQSKAPPAGMDASAMTRRLDAKEMGVLMGGGGEGGPAGSGKAQEPIEDTSPPGEAFHSSSADLGRLIDEKVDALGDAKPKPPPKPLRPGEPSVEDLPIEMPPPAEEGIQGDRGEAPPPARPVSASSSASSRAGRNRAPSGPGEGAAPTFKSVMPAHTRKADGGGRLMPFLLGGVVSGSVVAAALILGRQSIPENLSPPVPEVISQSLGGPSFGLLAVMIALSALAGILASLALPPEGEKSTGVSLFRCAVAAGLVGLLAGVGIALVRGGSELAVMAVPAASWTIALVLAGLLTGLVARVFGSR